NHRGLSRSDLELDPDCRGHSLVDQVHPADPNSLDYVADGKPFDGADVVWHRHYYSAGEAGAAASPLAHKPRQELLGEIRGRDESLTHRVDDFDVLGRAAQHLEGFIAHCDYVTGDLVYGNKGRLIDNHTAPRCVDKGMYGTEVDRQILSEWISQREFHNFTC